MRVSKLRVVEAHLETAIKLIAIEASPISTHLIIMACEEMIESVAKHKNVAPPADMRDFIVDEYQKDYRKLNRQMYNFFKHADRDADDILDSPATRQLQTINELKLALNLRNFASVGGKFPPCMTSYTSAIILKYPHIVKPAAFDQHPAVKKGLVEHSLAIGQDPSLFFTVLRHDLLNKRELPKIPEW